MGNTNRMSEESLSIFIEECNELLERLTLAALELEKGNHQIDLIRAFYRDIHTLKGSAALYGFVMLSRIAHAMETRFEELRESPCRLSQSETDLILQCIDLIGVIISGIQSGKSEDYSRIITKLEDDLAKAGGKNKMAG